MGLLITAFGLSIGLRLIVMGLLWGGRVHPPALRLPGPDQASGFVRLLIAENLGLLAILIAVLLGAKAALYAGLAFFAVALAQGIYSGLKQGFGLLHLDIGLALFGVIAVWPLLAAT